MNSKEYISSGIIESYILGHASPEEAGILECVMKNNAEVKAAFEETQKVFEDLATRQAVEPAAELKSKIWDTLQATSVSSPEIQQDANHTIGNETTPTNALPRDRWKTWGVAASVLLLLSVGGNILWMNHKDEMSEKMTAIQKKMDVQQQEIQYLNQKTKILTNPDIQKIVLKGVANHESNSATVYWDQSSKEVYLNAEALPAAPKGMQYQLWALENGKPVDAGMYSAEKDSRIALSKISAAQAFAITLEKEGGSEVPTMENMYVLGEI